MGGSKEDRWEPAVEHWSIAVSDGRALDIAWRSEIPIPRGGPHRFFFSFFSCIWLSSSLRIMPSLDLT
jgi:hypothetical protein